MAELLIRDENIARRLLAIAEREGRSVEALLDEMTRNYEAKADDEQPNPLLLMVQLAEQAQLEFEDDNVARRSREILNEEFGDYLLKRMRGDDGENQPTGG